MDQKINGISESSELALDKRFTRNYSYRNILEIIHHINLF